MYDFVVMVALLLGVGAFAVVRSIINYFNVEDEYRD